MRRRRPAVACALVLPAALGLVACGGSSTNGVDSKSPDAIVAAAKQAAESAISVHVAGSIAAAGSPTTYDLNLVRGKGGRGTVSINGLGFDLIRIGSTIYVKGSRAFSRRFGGAAAQRLQGRWLKVPSTTASVAAIGPFTDLPTFVDEALARQPNVMLTRGATTTIGGQKVVQVGYLAGKLSVATTGRPYPVQIASGGTSGGTITFDRWNVAVPLTAPADSVDIKQLQAGK